MWRVSRTPLGGRARLNGTCGTADCAGRDGVSEWRTACAGGCAELPECDGGRVADWCCPPGHGRFGGRELSVPSRRLSSMQSNSEPLAHASAAVAAALRLEHAQERIRALTGGGELSVADRLELAEWQREWVAAWRETEYVAAA
jgi:hypothetical protein